MDRAIRRIGLLAALSAAVPGCVNETGPAGTLTVSLVVEPEAAEPGDTIQVTVTAVPAGGVVVEVIRLTASGLVTGADSMRPSAAGTQSHFRAYALPLQPASGEVALVATAVGGDVADSAEVTVPVSDGEPPTVSSVSVTPDRVQPGDTFTVTYAATDNVGLTWTAIRASGAITASDSVTHEYTGSVSRSVAFVVPAATPLGGAVAISVVATDVAGQRDSAAATPVHVTDLTPPAASGSVYGPDVTPTFMAGDSLWVLVRGTDNHRLAWLGYRLGSPASVQDSLAVTDTLAGRGFRVIVQSGWVGAFPITAFAYDSLGNVAEAFVDSAVVLEGVRTPPAVPPATTADIDISLFLEPTLPDDTPGDNFWYAAGRVGDTRTATDALTVLRAVLRDAPLYTPSMRSGVWRWRYTVVVANSSFDANLTARVEGGEVGWEVRITAPQHGSYDLLWYDGRSRVDGTAGVWKAYPMELEPTQELARVDWSRPGTDLWTLILVHHGGLFLGESQGTYQRSGTGRALTWLNVFPSGTSEFDAVWDVANRDGFIVTPVYNSGQRACWGLHRENVTCPP